MRGWIAPVLLLDGGCAGPSTVLTILPPEQEGGSVGGVAVISEDGQEESIYDEVGQSGKTGSGAGSKSLSDKKLADLLAILPIPPKPISFTIVFGKDETRIPEESRVLLDQIRQEIFL